MDFGLSEEQLLLEKTVRSFLGDRVPITLGGSKSTLDFNFRFSPEDIPADLRQQSTPNNLITYRAAVHYRDQDGDGEITANPAVA